MHAIAYIIRKTFVIHTFLLFMHFFSARFSEAFAKQKRHDIFIRTNFTRVICRHYSSRMDTSARRSKARERNR